jgi:hypothetical protein
VICGESSTSTDGWTVNANEFAAELERLPDGPLRRSLTLWWLHGGDIHEHLGLTGHDRRRARRARRDSYLRQVATLVAPGEPSAWLRAVAVKTAIDQFERRGFDAWKRPPRTERFHLLWLASRTEPLPTTAKQLSRILGTSFAD